MSENNDPDSQNSTKPRCDATRLYRMPSGSATLMQNVDAEDATRIWNFLNVMLEIMDELHQSTRVAVTNLLNSVFVRFVAIVCL